LKANPEIYDDLSAKAVKLTQGFKAAAQKNDIALVVDTRGSMFGFFFNENKPTNIKEVANSDFERFSKFHSEMLKRGFYFACSQYETGFICTVMTDEDINNCINAAEEVMEIL
ncbi:MAG: aspartate aminotransferase family protein, partial [Campylobacteraceae bacterium]|nr:aspartate aminotransferase family protein [Campylobacteraceae bacterium]